MDDPTSNITSLVVATVAKILDVEIIELNLNTKPTDLIEWDSFANMQIWIELTERTKKSIDYNQYIKCSCLQDLITLFSQ